MPDEPSTSGEEEQPAGKRRGVIVSVPTGIRELMRERSAETRITFTDLALDAVEDQVTRLPGVIESEAPTQRPGRIFARTTYQRGSRREDEVTINLQLLSSDIDILDKMWKEAGARSRNQYLATALRLYLQPEPSGGTP